MHVYNRLVFAGLFLWFLVLPALAQEDAKALYNKGVGLVNGGQAEEAAEVFRQAIAADPSFALAHYNLGVALQKLKKHPEALAAFQEAGRLDPAYAPAFMNTGASYQAMGKPDEAASAYREAVRLAPEDPEAQFGLCWMLLAAEKKQEAAREYAALARLSQSRADALYTNYKAMPGSEGAPDSTPPSALPAESPAAPEPLPGAADASEPGAALASSPSAPSSPPPDPAHSAEIGPGAAPSAGAASGASGPTFLTYRAAAGTSRYRAVETTTFQSGAGGKRPNVQIEREIVYSIRVTEEKPGVLARETTVQSLRVKRDGKETAAPATEAAARSHVGPTGELLDGAPGAEPVWCRPVFPAGPAAIGGSWSRVHARVPGGFPSTEVRMSCKLAGVVRAGPTDCGRVTMEASAPGPATERLKVVVLWDLARGRLNRLRGRAIKDDVVKQQSDAVGIPRKVTQDLAVDLLP